jgi:CheY-specific phosphatase CheX
MLIIPSDLTRLADELDQTVATIFQTMMGLDVKPVTTQWLPEPQRVAATIHFAGNWSGVLVLEVNRSHACLFAARFLSIEEPEAVDDDVRDVLGELANMIGGNLKSTLAPGAVLSIPEVIDGNGFNLRICAGTSSERQAFACDNGVFWVSLIQTP